ncbi:MAG: hypothetical protein H5T78_27985 [Nocardia sp.]|nr:hypothetical protein [Nocardia sp.]
MGISLRSPPAALAAAQHPEYGSDRRRERVVHRFGDAVHKDADAGRARGGHAR